MILDQYKPSSDWFSHNPYGIHGISHESRVLVWVDVIGQSMIDSGQAIDIEVVRWSAVIHDVGRWNDGPDPEHGARSAAWLEQNRNLFPQINEEQLRAISFCCIWHVPPDQAIPKMTMELTCLKDADGLERVRIRDLDPRYLRTQFARAHVNDAQTLLDLAPRKDAPDPWEAVRAAAIQQGWWR